MACPLSFILNHEDELSTNTRDGKKESSVSSKIKTRDGKESVKTNIKDDKVSAKTNTRKGKEWVGSNTRGNIEITKSNTRNDRESSDTSTRGDEESIKIITNNDRESTEASSIDDRKLMILRRPRKRIRLDAPSINFNRTPTMEALATFGIKVANIYSRRANKPFSKVPILSTPPTRSAPIYCDVDPPSHEIDFLQFNVFKSLLEYPELVVEFAKHLHVDDFISLYAISKDFHKFTNARFTTMVLAQAGAQSPESSRAFVFRCYKSLCIRDPGFRPNESIPDEVRYVPSLRWLRMLTFRERVVDEILICLSNEGLFLPKDASLTLKKIWFTIDIGDNARRVGIIHNTAFWTNRDLYLATMFFLKLDMRLTDPVTGNGNLGFRKMLLGQPSLFTLLRVLKREELLTRLEVLRMMATWNYRPAARHANLSILGAGSDKVGQLQLEGWGTGTQKLIQVDELVMREGVRRELELQKEYLDMMIYGFVDKVTFEDRWHTEVVLGKEDKSDDDDDNDDDDDDEGETGSDDDDEIFNMLMNEAGVGEEGGIRGWDGS